MNSNKIKELMGNQGYRFVGDHSAIKICRWTKKSLRDEGVCYKEKFYGIKSHLCCQMSPWLGCNNKCIHCWRAIEFDFNKIVSKNKIDSPKNIIGNCIKAQRKLLQGFKIDPHGKKRQLSRANQEKYQEAQEPMQFAISLSGEPTLYEKIGELIKELKNRGKTSFLVTNGLYPEKLQELVRKKQLPTQLYISVNTSNKKLFDKFHRSTEKKAWEKLNKSLEIMSKLKRKTRTVFRMNLVKNLNMNKEHTKEYAELIKKSKADFIELKSYMAVGFARNRLGYNRMPTMKDMEDFTKRIAKVTGYKIEDQDERSRVFLLIRDDSVKRFISKADL